MVLAKSKVPGATNALQTWSTGAMAGLVGGTVEVLWIILYENLSAGEAAAVARGVTESLLPNFAAPSAAVPLGIAIHMGLAILLGIAIFVFVRSVLPRTAPAVLEPLAVVGLLIGVWAVNFFVILPTINPEFVSLVPYTASLVSKVLFGFSAALTLKILDGLRPLET